MGKLNSCADELTLTRFTVNHSGMCQNTDHKEVRLLSGKRESMC